jgi:uncharacterized membrane protein YdjX (TVP38/TMEM64 family)
MKTKHKIWGYIGLGVLLIIIAISTYFIPGFEKFTSPEYVRYLLIGLGNWGYLVFVILLIVSVLSPVPATPIILAGGYVYGLITGSLLALISIIIGGSILFLLVKKLGEPLLRMFIDEHHIQHFRHILKKRGKIAALISFVVPLFPSSSVMLIVGLTGIGYIGFIALVILGHIPRFLIINSFGADLHSGLTLQTVLVASLGVLLILVAAFRVPIRKFLFKELRELENEAIVVEKFVEKEVIRKKRKK